MLSTALIGGNMGTRRIRVLAATVSAVVVVAGLSAMQPSAAAPKEKTNWSPCFRAEGPFECATVRVPLDYDQPNGAKISIAMVRLPAADPAQRIGSLFLNPGGPGGSGVDFAVGAGQFLFTQDVRDRFDIVGFDPRGIARSDAAAVLRQRRGSGMPYFTPFAFPMTPTEVDGWIAADRYLDAACARRGGAILDHMSTANVARDMDLLRQAVGDEQADLLRRLLRHDARPDLRQHVPGQLPGARDRRRARPDRLDDRGPGRAGPSVRHQAAERRGRSGHPRGVLPSLRRGRRRVPAVERRTAPRPGTPPWPTRCWPARCGPGPEHR